MLQIITSNRFEWDLKAAIRRGKDIQKLKRVIEILCIPAALPAQNRDHSLTGEYKGFRECHLEPDWLLIYRIDLEAEGLFLLRIGSHADLFK